jgi:MYXO-CTERM domain-containing protein
LAACLAGLVTALGAPGRAAADGAFPDSMQLLVPADQPHRIILATNFGLIISEDDGATWEWTCEARDNDVAILYQRAAAPSDRIFSVLAINGMVYSDDVACNWTPSGGALTTAVARDAFADPTSAARVFAVAVEPSDALIPSSVYRSDDGGVTFGPPLFTAPTGGDLLGVESAVSDPATVYLAIYGTNSSISPSHLEPILGRSTDGGGHWTTANLVAALGPSVFRIIAVDPTDAQRLFLRVTISSDNEALAVSEDGGLTFAKPVTVPGRLTAFVRLTSGTILLGAISGVGDPLAYRSTDQGRTFVAWPGAPHLRALAERDGRLFAAADNYLDHFAAGVSTDEGVTFQPLLTYNHVSRIKPCAQDRCQDFCINNLAALTLWPVQVCGDLPDAGTPRVSPPKGGCGCQTGRGATSETGALLGALLLLLLASRRRAPARRR